MTNGSDGARVGGWTPSCGVAIVMIGLFGMAAPAAAVQFFVGDDPAKVGIVDQQPMDRGEGLYDTTPSATGRYDRIIDADTQDPARRYEALPEYFNNSDQKSLDLSLINGAWYCAPTTALSLVKYWDNDPRFPNLFDPGAGDTDRSVLLILADLMDTDDLTDNGAADAAERHLRYAVWGHQAGPGGVLQRQVSAVVQSR